MRKQKKLIKPIILFWWKYWKKHAKMIKNGFSHYITIYLLYIQIFNVWHPNFETMLVINWETRKNISKCIWRNLPWTTVKADSYISWPIYENLWCPQNMKRYTHHGNTCCFRSSRSFHSASVKTSLAVWLGKSFRLTTNYRVKIICYTRA